MLNFNSVPEVMDFITKELELRLVTPAEYAALKKDGKFFIFSPEGRETLRRGKFYHIKEVRDKIGQAFNNFKCEEFI